jgi:predicted transcriptional regulator
MHETSGENVKQEEEEATSTASICGNPMCSCDPCACEGDGCACGSARLGDLERRVIDVLWEDPRHELTGRDVANVLPDYAYTTVATVLDRLVHKNLVRRRMDGRTIRFAATGTGATHTATLMRETLGTARNPDAALVRFVQSVSPSEADVLRRALNDLGTAQEAHGPDPRAI